MKHTVFYTRTLVESIKVMCLKESVKSKINISIFYFIVKRTVVLKSLGNLVVSSHKPFTSGPSHLIVIPLIENSNFTCKLSPNSKGMHILSIHRYVVMGNFPP